MNPQTGRMRIRMVDVTSDRYRIAYAYMLRLKPSDFEDPRELAKLAAALGVTPQQVREEFGYLVEGPLATQSIPMPARVTAS